MHISRFGVIPKHHQPGKWRLTIDLSHPSDHSVNDGIPKSLCSLSYITIDSAISKILELGKDHCWQKSTLNMPIDYFPYTPLITICWLCADIHGHLPSIQIMVGTQVIQPPSRPTVIDLRAAQGNPPPPLLGRLPQTCWPLYSHLNATTICFWYSSYATSLVFLYH